MNRTPKAMSLFFAIALCFTAAQAQAQPPHFIITGSGTSFTATKDDSPFGTAGTILNVINAIRAECGDGCGIQFGDGSDPLSIGSSRVEFVNLAGSNPVTWGSITLSGRISSSNNSTATATAGTININLAASGALAINSTADIENADGQAIHHRGTRPLNISGGTISAPGTSGQAIHNNSSAAVTITGGTITAPGTSGRAIHNNSTAAVTISGGEVRSGNTDAASGTIHNNSSGTVNIHGGFISNTNANGNAVYSNNANGRIQLGGDPAIIGIIRTPQGTLLAQSDPAFAPSTGKRYDVRFPAYGIGMVAVINGKGFAVNFNFLDVPSELLIAEIGNDLAVYTDNTPHFIITGSNDQFTATKDGEAFRENLEIQDLINEIRGQCGTFTSCSIQFGAENDDVLDIGSTSLQFANSGVNIWGNITLSGKITSSNANNIGGTIRINFSVSGAGALAINSTADITNTDRLGIAIYPDGRPLNISGGTILATGTSGTGIRAGSGPININGPATITGANAISLGNGTVTISGDAKISSSSTNYGTIHNTSSTTSGTVNIHGGTIENTAGGSAVNVSSTNATIRLGGDPVIIGRITVPFGVLQAQPASPAFEPAQGKIYNVRINSNYVIGGVAVANGASFEEFFNFSNVPTGFEIAASGSDLVAKSNITNGYGFSGAGTSASPYIITHGAGEHATINSALAAIRPVCSSNCHIQFGNGNDMLDIGSGTATFNNTGGNWSSTLTLSGKITSSGSTITISHNITTLNSTADIASTSGTATDNAISYGVSSGRINISGGTVSSTAGRAISLSTNAASLNISGGTVSSTANRAISFAAGSSTVTISGDATVSALDSIFRNVYDNTRVVLGGDPSITGAIRTWPGNLSVNSTFAPGDGRIYTIDFASPTQFGTAVTGGGEFHKNFSLAQALTAQEYSLIIDGNNLVLSLPVDDGYAFTGDGTSESPYAITQGDGPYPNANSVLGAIRSRCGGIGCHIQFGDGSEELNIGADSLLFSGAWGSNITLSGKITSSKNSVNSGTIHINLTGNSLATNSTADIANTAGNGRAIYLVGNSSDGGGVRQLNISGGTISATGASGIAIRVAASTVTVSGDAVISSENTGSGTIHNEGDGRINIHGGTIKNTAAGGIAVSNGRIQLGGSPIVEGRIRTHLGSVSAAENFEPSNNSYALDFISYTLAQAAVAGGAGHIESFTLASAEYDLMEIDNNLYIANVVSFDLGGGTGVPAIKARHNNAIEKPADPSKEHHAFEGWYLGDDDEAFNFATPITANITLTAKWKLNSYTVTFNSDLGTPVAEQTIDHGETATEPAPPTRVAHEFEGWHLGEEAFDFDTPIIANITLTAKWKINENAIVVSFNSDGGSHVEGQEVAEGETATEPTPPPTRAGHTFAGWYLGEATEPFDFDTPITESITLTAKWNIISYTVTWNTDDGTPAPTQLTVNHGGEIAEPAAMTKIGHTFASWHTNEELTSTAVSFPVPNVTEDAEFWARWNIIRYTVSFNSDGGTTVANQPNISHGSLAARPGNPSRINHTFEYWYLGDDEEAFEFENTPITGAITLTAKWTLNIGSYTITWHTDGGTPAPTQTTVSQGNAIAAPAAMTKANHTFGGWYRNEELTGAAVSFPVLNVTENAEFWAKWTLNSYTVSFNSDGGTAVESQTINHGGTATEPTPPTKAGHTFEGWYLGEATEAFDFENTPITGAITLTAKWTINSYTVTFKALETDEEALKTETVNHGSDATAPTDDPTRTGYTFTGWSPAFTNVTSNLTVVAQWEIISYTVTWHADGGAPAPTQTTVDHGGEIAAPAAMTKAGHTFAGWHTNEALTTAATFPIANATDDAEFWAKWTLNSYTVSFKALETDEEALKTETVNHGSDATAPTEEPTRPGYTFTGWSPAFTNVTSNLTVVAQWNIISYTVSFNSDGGSSVESQTINHGGTAVAPTAPTKAGHTFAGWHIGEATEAFDFENTPITANTTLTAKWTDISSIFANRENPKIGAIGIQTYYDLKGTSLGTTKPTAPGVYLEKHGTHVRRIAIR